MKKNIDEIFALFTPEETARLMANIDLGKVGRNKRRLSVSGIRRTVTAFAATAVGVAAFALGIMAVLPALRGTDDIITPAVQPIDTTAVDTAEQTSGGVFTVDKLERSGEIIFLHYSINDPLSIEYGDVYGYDYLTVTDKDGGWLYKSEGNILAGGALCRAENGGGILEINAKDYSGEVTLTIDNLYIADSSKVTVENARRIEEYTITLSERVELSFVVPELDEMEFTVLANDIAVTVEGYDVIADIRVGTVVIEVDITVPDYDGDEPSVIYPLSGTTYEEFIKMNDYIREQRDNGDNLAWYRYYKPLRWIAVEFENGIVNTSFLESALPGPDDPTTVTITLKFDKPINPDDIKVVRFQYGEKAEPDGTIYPSEHWGESVTLYSK